MVASIIVLMTLAVFHASATLFALFEQPYTVQYHKGYLFQRQNQCLSSQRFCSGTDGSSGCCSTDSQCAADNAGHVACCPSGAACTGRLDGTAGAANLAATQPATQAQGASPPPTPTMNANGGGATIPNAYYPYVMLPTTYPNAELCSSAFSSCRSEFTKCTNSLTAVGNGVTVSGALGGVTALPGLDAASAGAVCSSLSTLACYNLGLGNCVSYGTGAAPVTAGNAAPSGCAQIYRVAVAVAMGVAGQAVR